MEIKFLKDTKNEVEVQLQDLTLAEILRVYLNEEPEVVFVAWKREHMTEKPILKIKTKDKDVRMVVKSTIELITKDLDDVLSNFKAIK